MGVIEMTNVRQVPNDYLRRWFCDKNFDLVAWYRPDGEIHGFQLSYDRTAQEKALTYVEERGISHHLVDSGEDSPLANRTPVLVEVDGRAGMTRVFALFTKSEQGLPLPLRMLVRQKIREYGHLPIPWAERGGAILVMTLVGSVALMGLAIGYKYRQAQKQDE